MKKGDIVRHILTGEKMLIIDFNYWEQFCCRRMDLTAVWLEGAELELDNGVDHDKKS